MTVDVIIPCRSKSVAVPHKNIRPLLGRPLMSYAITPAKKCKIVDHVYVSTDSPEYAEIAKDWGAEVPFLRPEHLAEDVPTEDVIVDFVNKLPKMPEVIVVLQCTTPFITPTNITDLVMHVKPYGLNDSAVTVCEADHPEWMFSMNDYGRLKRLSPGLLKGSQGVRQALRPRYRVNGAGYATTYSTLVYRSSIIASNPYGVIMPKWRSIDIDTEEDFRIVERVMKKRAIA